MSNIPTLAQKKAVIRVLGDLIRHNKDEVSDEDYTYFLYIGLNVLKLKESDIKDAQSEYFAYNWYSLIGDLDSKYQLAFWQLMLSILTHDGRMPSSLEKADFENYLSALPNSNGLPLIFDEVKRRISNDFSFLNGLLFPWI